MKKAKLFLLIKLIFICTGYAQHMTDSIKKLPEVTIYPAKPLLLYVTSSAAIIGQEQISDHAVQSFVPVMNAVAGLRMEERSPGSYRLSIRGSLLRSPFGIRNIKIYLNEFPLTDAGGNTYLNLIDANSIQSIQILKGPEGSMFGANTGGVILLDSENKTDSVKREVSLKAGSYKLFDEQINLHRVRKHYSFSLNQAYQRSDGYRRNSALQRNYIYTLQKWRYKTGNIKLLLLGSRLHYETPGGLTSAQAEQDPRQARPATSTLPGAEEQKAGIYNSTIYAGISNEVYFLSICRHVVTAFGSYTDFKNPFITNYETRKEQSLGLRTYLEAGKKLKTLNWKFNLGAEAQRTESAVSNYDNNSGSKGNLQAADDLNASQYFIFSQLSALINTRVQIEAAISFNNYQYDYKNTFPEKENTFTRKKINTALMPRIGISYRIISKLVWRASASKGYSPPTLAEFRPSDNNIYNNLQAEYGWNYESGFRFESKTERWNADLVFFRFNLQNAIVRRVNAAGAEYFVNAGGTSQSGVELQLAAVLIKNRGDQFIRDLEFRNALTWYDFSFTEYSITNTSYSGNKLTGVPPFVNVSSLKIFFPKQFELFLSYNYTDIIPLNDANSVYASSYHLLGSRLTWKYNYKNKYALHFFAGADNLLNAAFSLGNDLNAAGNRYFNPAPGRTYYGGVKLGF